MPLARKRPTLPRPHTTIETRTGALRFYLGDCLDVLRALPDGGVGTVVTSPPYNLGVRYRSYHDALPHERYLEWTDSWIAATVRALGPHGSLNDCPEFIFHFTPQGRTPLDRRAIGVEYQDASNISRWRTGGDNRRCRGNTWFVPYVTIQSRDKDRPHPATFPPRIPEYCLRLHGLARVGVVLDPFLGLGSTAVAAAQLGLDFIGIELDEHYLNEAVERVKKELGARS